MQRTELSLGPVETFNHNYYACFISKEIPFNHYIKVFSIQCNVPHYKIRLELISGFFIACSKFYVYPKIIQKMGYSNLLEVHGPITLLWKKNSYFLVEFHNEKDIENPEELLQECRLEIVWKDIEEVEEVEYIEEEGYEFFNIECYDQSGSYNTECFDTTPLIIYSLNSLQIEDIKVYKNYYDDNLVELDEVQELQVKWISPKQLSIINTSKNFFIIKYVGTDPKNIYVFKN